MSLFDLLKRRRNSTRDFLGVQHMGENYLATNQGSLFYYHIQPTNVSVLSEDALRGKINALMTVLRGHGNIEILCLNSRENFDENKQYLKERMAKETVPQVIRLLEQELVHYDKIQTQTVTARQFLLIIRYRGEITKETSSYLNQVERLVRQHGFLIKQCKKTMLKQVLAVYWNQNVTTEYFEDYDGERWVIFNE